MFFFNSITIFHFPTTSEREKSGTSTLQLGKFFVEFVLKINNILHQISGYSIFVLCGGFH